jgi:hypothetical protein
MPSPQTHIAVAQPSPTRRMSPLLTSNTLGRDVCLTLDTKNKPYAFVPRMYENDYAPPAPPPPSPVNFPSGVTMTWSQGPEWTARNRGKEEEQNLILHFRHGFSWDGRSGVTTTFFLLAQHFNSFQGLYEI